MNTCVVFRRHVIINVNKLHTSNVWVIICFNLTFVYMFMVFVIVYFIDRDHNIRIITWTIPFHYLLLTSGTVKRKMVFFCESSWYYHYEFSLCILSCKIDDSNSNWTKINSLNMSFNCHVRHKTGWRRIQSTCNRYLFSFSFITISMYLENMNHVQDVARN